MLVLWYNLILIVSFGTKKLFRLNELFAFDLVINLEDIYGL